MDKRLRIALSLFLIPGMIGSLFGCSSKEAGAPKSPSDQPSVMEYKGGPAELVVLDYSTGTTEEQFQKFFVEPVKAKYPEINLVQTKDSLEKLMAAGAFPDIILVSNVSLINILDMAIPEDLTKMIETYRINLGQIEPAAVEQTKKLGDQKAFYGMPFAMNYGAMAYNKDIFDKFAVPYPKDVMTYEEALDLGKKLTRADGGTNYIGIMPPDLRQMYWQYGVPVFDRASGKAILTTDRHAKVFSLLQQFYSVPGYVEKGKFRHATDVFFKEQRMAMYTGWIAAVVLYFNKAGSSDLFKWDLAAHPGYSDRPGFGKEVDYHMAVVNKESKYKDAAYTVLSTLVSEEVQTKMSKAGRVSVLTNDAIRKAFGSDSDLFKGKNLEAIFKVKPSPLPDASKFDPKINAIVNGDVSQDVAVKGIDINTALRSGEEKANKEIAVP